MTTESSFARLVQRIITLFGEEADITKYVGTRIYGSHISTITDYKLPAISIMATDNSRMVDQNFFDDYLMQIDLWFGGVGADAYTWDDVFECMAAIKNKIHRNGGYNTNIKIYAVEVIGEGPMLYEQETGILHYPSRWRARVKA